MIGCGLEATRKAVRRSTAITLEFPRLGGCGCETERADHLVHTERAGRQDYRKDAALGRVPETKSWQYMDWHIINHKDYIDGPFDSFEAALAEACSLGRETRPEPRVKRRSDQFFIYRAPYDREEKWRPEFWICTKDGALRLGVPEDLFDQPLLEMAVGAGSLDAIRLSRMSGAGD